MKILKILALSGSLRKTSYNTELIHALSKLAPEGLEIIPFEGIGKLPLFNPDLDIQNTPPVTKLCKALEKSDGLIIASPEYAHGISGVLKNTLDWLVAGEEFVDMPVALFNTSPRASHAQNALKEVIKTMSGNIIEDASISIPLLGSNLNSDGIIKHPEISLTLKEAIKIFKIAILARDGLMSCEEVSSSAPP